MEMNADAAVRLPHHSGFFFNPINCFFLHTQFQKCFAVKAKIITSHNRDANSEVYGIYSLKSSLYRIFLVH